MTYTTNTPGIPAPAFIVPHPQDARIAVVAGRRVYLGDDKLRRLFWALAVPLGRAWRVEELQRLMDGYETTPDLNLQPGELRRAQQRLRQHICRLGKALAEHGADGHLIVCRRLGEVWLQERFCGGSRSSVTL